MEVNMIVESTHLNVVRFLVDSPNQTEYGQAAIMFPEADAKLFTSGAKCVFTIAPPSESGEIPAGDSDKVVRDLPDGGIGHPGTPSKVPYPEPKGPGQPVYEVPPASPVIHEGKAPKESKVPETKLKPEVPGK